MQTLANTLYITTQGSYVHREHDTLQVEVDRTVKLTVPLHHVEGVVCFGRVQVSSGVYAVCAERDLHIAFLTEQGRFQARAEGPIHGNVLLRRQQYRLVGSKICTWSGRRPG
jgi:CRISPR-associated protein Cas1